MTLIAASLALAVQAKLAMSEVPTSLLKPVPAKETVLMKVNGKDIKASDVEALLWDWRQDDILNDLVNFRVVRDAAALANISATDKEIEDAKQKLMEALATTLSPGQTLQQLMDQEGTTNSRLYLRVHTEVLLKKLILKGFNKNDFVDISTIVIRHTADAADTKRALDIAEAAHKDLTAGKPWADILKQVVTDQRAIEANGKVGWRFLSAFPNTVRDEIVTGKAGMYTKPAVTSNGIQIFRIDAKGADATGENLAILEEWYVNAMRQDTVNKLRANAKIERVKSGG
jgi:parvulin-like peptidyl-prolyl isomerase